MFRRIIAGLSAPDPPAPAPSPIPAETLRDPARMTWRNGDASKSEIRVGGVLVMTASISISPGPGFVGVVGESQYQDALLRARPHDRAKLSLCSRRLLSGSRRMRDASAVAVVIEPFGTVGYISREIARKFAPIIDAAAPTPVRCPAQLRGGSQEKPSLGVVLDSALATGARLSHYDPNHTPEYERCAEYHERRRANEAFIAETKPWKSRRASRQSGGIELHYKRLAISRPSL